MVPNGNRRTAKSLPPAPDGPTGEGKNWRTGIGPVRQGEGNDQNAKVAESVSLRGATKLKSCVS